MLTMLNISGGYPEEEAAARAAKREARRTKHLAKKTAKRVAKGAGAATVGVLTSPDTPDEDN